MKQFDVFENIALLATMVFSIILLLVVALGLSERGKNIPTTKPFIIIEKQKFSTGYDTYKYVDKNGIVSKSFDDYADKYNIGDTLR